MSQTNNAPLLAVQNIEAFYGAVQAIRGVSVSINKGQLVTLLGANGAGKTTLLKCISAVLLPQKGQIEFQGEPIHKTTPDVVVKKGIVHVPEGREIFPFLTVAENLMMGAFTRTDRAKLPEDLKRVYHYFPILEERAQQQAGYLSGGQQQMLAIGRGLMAAPQVMLLDEPSLGLSPLLVQEIMAIVQRLNKEEGVTIMLVEQNAQVALNVADYGFVMEMGRIVMADTAERLLQSTDIQEFYLGMQNDAAGCQTGERSENGGYGQNSEKVVSDPTNSEVGSPRGQRRWKRRKTWR